MALLYSTFLGSDAQDVGEGIAVDEKGNAYVVGLTRRPTNFPFPTTPGAFQSTYNGGDADTFVAKIDTTKPGTDSLVYSTLLGGSGDDAGIAIAVDEHSNAYVTGFTISPNFPTANALQPTSGGGEDAFVTKLNADGSALVFSTYLGGPGEKLKTCSLLIPSTHSHFR